MKKFVFICGIIFSAYAFASSQWIIVGENNDRDIFYIDMNSLQRSGDSVTFWTKVNFGKRDEQGDLSDKSQRTINCRTREVILRWLMTYDDINNMGKNTASFEPKRSSWRPIPPDSMSSRIYEVVCRR